MADTIYCGKGKKKNDTWLQVTINPDIISQHIQEYEGKKYVKLNINIGKTDKFGKDVQISIDTWKPDSAKQPTQQSQPNKPQKPPIAQNEYEEDLLDSLPF